jgi:hypothetical protein
MSLPLQCLAQSRRTIRPLSRRQERGFDAQAHALVVHVFDRYSWQHPPRRRCCRLGCTIAIDAQRRSRGVKLSPPPLDLRQPDRPFIGRNHDGGPASSRPWAPPSSALPNSDCVPRSAQRVARGAGRDLTLFYFVTHGRLRAACPACLLTMAHAEMPGKRSRADVSRLGRQEMSALWRLWVDQAEAVDASIPQQGMDHKVKVRSDQ